MPLPSELEALCQRLERGEPEPSAASLIRQQAREIDELWDRLSRAYAVVRRETPATSFKWRSSGFVPNLSGAEKARNVGKLVRPL